jgi:hypothetical protein
MEEEVKSIKGRIRNKERVKKTEETFRENTKEKTPSVVK